MNIIIFGIPPPKSTCEVENDKRRPMGGIDGCILLGNELLVMHTLACMIPDLAIL